MPIDQRRATIVKLVSKDYPSLSDLKEVLRLNHMDVCEKTIKRDIAKLRESMDIQYSRKYKGYYIEYVYRREVIIYYQLILQEPIEIPKYTMPN